MDATEIEFTRSWAVKFYGTTLRFQNNLNLSSQFFAHVTRRCL